MFRHRHVIIAAFVSILAALGFAGWLYAPRGSADVAPEGAPAADKAGGGGARMEHPVEGTDKPHDDTAH